MSLETLLEAAKYLEHKNDDKKTSPSKQKVMKLTGPSSEIVSEVSASHVAASHHATSNPGARGQSADAPELVTSCSHIGAANWIVSQTMTSAYAGQSVESSTLQKTKEVSSVPNTAQRVPSEISPENSDESNLSQSSNMNPLFARARAAVKNASFGDNEGIIIPPPRQIPGSALTISAPRGVIIDQFAYQPNGALGLSIPQHYVPVNVVPPKPAPVAVMNSPKKSVEVPAQPERTLSILPSIKSNVDTSSFSTQQMKPVKRNVTLTHNQLEKNRRAHLKECFEALKLAIPRLGMRRSSNLTILKAALKQIQVLKRKSVTHQHVLAQLFQEREEKRKKEAALLNELLKIADRATIDKYVAVAMLKSAKVSPPLSILDPGQLSTSTASEAEDEEERQNNPGYNEILFRPLPAHSPALIPGLMHHNQTVVSSTSANAESKIVRSMSSSTPSTVYIQNPPPRMEHPKHNQPQVPSTGVSAVSAAESSSAPTQAQVLRLVVPQKSIEATNPGDTKPKRSPIRTQPVRRCATPTPSSDFVQFFPCFPLGSGGSPPLMSSQKFDFVSDKTKVEDQQPEINALDHKPRPIGSFSTSALANLRAADHSHNTRTTSDASAVGVQKTSNRNSDINNTPVVDTGNSKKNIPQITSSDSSNSSPSKTVIVTSFTGYEVKVKYLNTSVTSAPSIKAYQTRVPMKKRPVNVDSFANHPVETSKSISSPSSTASSELKMTSLYVGASASLLDSTSNTAFTSTSDHESDRESPFLEHKKFSSHWRKSILNEQSAKEAAELKQKSLDKNRKRTFQVHQYEAPDPKASLANSTKTQNDAKRKATFNLWDRKHHAITMTTATNWRGKQQLITTKAKGTTVPSTHVPADARPSAGGSSVTKVSYSLLQKTAKPSVPNSLMSSGDLVSTSSVLLANPPPTSVSQPKEGTKVALNSVGNGSTSAMSLSGQRLQHAALPVQFPANQIGYQIIQSPASAPATLAPGTLTTSKDFSAVNPRLLPTASAGFNPPNFTTVSNSINSANAATSKAALHSSDASAFLQQAALVAAPNNSLQLPQIPYVLPVSYVMYPPGVPANGMQLATLPQAGNKILPNNIAAQTLPGPTLKRPISPAAPSKPPSRNASNGSASSTTLSADSVDLDNAKSGLSHPKKVRLSDPPLPGLSHPNNVGMSQPVPRLAQPQLIVPGNPGFMVAAPTSGFNLPLSLFGYPVQAYPGAGGIQALSMATAADLVSGQAALHGIGQTQMWPVGQTIIPAADAASALPPNPPKGNSLSAPFHRSAKVD